ncbi:hypothetical protein JRC49_09630 [Clostridiales bacterium FE2011]|nr:hypothetical protein JRC49_09630 [Clostridiales bacterium FE2011]
MPSRILKDSILTDKAFNSLTVAEESIYHRLLVSADDYGIFYADPILLLRLLYPRKTDIPEETIRESLDHLEEAGFIRRYTADGEDYLKILPWEKHQRLRNGRHKFPCPEGFEEEVPPETAAEAEKGTESKEGIKKESKPQQEKASKEKTTGPDSKIADEIVIDLLLHDNTKYNVTREEIDEFSALYPAIDVLQEYRGMKAWCLSNPQKRKTRNGIKKFINGWLASAQKQNQNAPPASQKPLPVNPFL